MTLAESRTRAKQALPEDYYAEISQLPGGEYHYAVQLGGSIVSEYGLPQYAELRSGGTVVKQFEGVEGVAMTHAAIRAEAEEALRRVKKRRGAKRETIR